jgi:release factor glutamine methyltransferase
MPSSNAFIGIQSLRTFGMTGGAFNMELKQRFYLRPDYIIEFGFGTMKLDHSIKIETFPGTYAPAEDSYLLLSAIEVSKGQRVLELGCGTGIIAMHCAKFGCMVKAADISLDAIENARLNAAINVLDMDLVHSNLFEKVQGKFDAIIFNPPYLSVQDSEGLSDSEKWPLVGGEGGHEVSVRFLVQAPKHLSTGGRIYLLTSSESEKEVIATASYLYSARKIAEQRIFFELLAVYELRLEKS